MKVIYPQPEGWGWGPVELVARLTARLLGAELEVVSRSKKVGYLRAASSFGPRSRRGEVCLLIAPAPGDLWALPSLEYFTQGHEHVAAWVIDSFWVDRIPAVAKRGRHFDQFFVPEAESVRPWEIATGRPVSTVACGTDALDMGSGSPQRPIDLQRIGRQPQQWDDDESVAQSCAIKGLAFAGRPEGHADPMVNQITCTRAFARAKYTLSFSNVHSPAPYVHPTREYLTGRWTDALANGATVAGISPRSQCARELLWPEATLELGSTERDAGVQIISEALADWTPSIALTNHRMALERLDWRWRIKQIADKLGVSSPLLDQELLRLKDAIAKARLAA